MNTDHGLPASPVPDGILPTTPRSALSGIDLAGASSSLRRDADLLRQRGGRSPSGPTASAEAAPPASVTAEQERQKKLGEGSSGPAEGESMRKFAAKQAGGLQVIKPTVELIELLQAGKIEEFNAERPAGRLDLSGIHLKGRNLAGVDFRNCILTRADLVGCDMTGALLQNAELPRADLEGAILSGVKAYKASFTHANLKKVKSATEAQFTEADFSYAEMQEGNFSGIQAENAKFIMAQLDHAKFKFSVISKAVLARAVCNRTDFEGTWLDEARFYQARGKDVIFKNAVLVGAEAVESVFTSSNQRIENEQILQTTFEGAWIQDFIHNNAIPDALLYNARKTGIPPADLMPKISELDKGKILIDGLPGTDKALYDSTMAEINQLIGLKQFKAMIPELLSHIKASLAREQFGLPAFERKLHYVLVGPPGVGKTTCSRLMAKLFKSFGLLAEGHVLETDKSGLIAGYAGQSLSKTNELIDDSLGGALILDEIYALTEAKNDDYAKDALVVLVKRLWDDRHKFAAFFLGYPKPMKDFIATNPGFDRRMAGIIELPPYTSGELTDIFKLRMKKLAIEHTPEMLAQVSVVTMVQKEIKQELFGNAGSVENLVEDLSKRMSQRIDRSNLLKDRKALVTATAEDIPCEKYAKVALKDLPALSEMRWVDQNGKEYKHTELPTTGEFPNLTEESLEKIKQFVASAGIEDIETKH